MEHEKIERINELTCLSRERELTHEELVEREALRREYLDGFRQNARAVQALIEGILMQGPEKRAIVVRSPEGLVEKVEPLKKKEDKH